MYILDTFYCFLYCIVNKRFVMMYVLMVSLSQGGQSNFNVIINWPDDRHMSCTSTFKSRYELDK